VNTCIGYGPRVNKCVASPFCFSSLQHWGPNQVYSPFEMFYFITFIDDFSCCTWAFYNEKSF